VLINAVFGAVLQIYSHEPTPVQRGDVDRFVIGWSEL